ncbi:hypothetical protein GS4_06_00060 [Gordonia soli NBRC 108243]|uniref:Uncharacterized protein n=1 Tax=Gordonia soli NBRC 108243 TaxID=1223545 RepID=M0QEX2_9ACTN|nr:hypothetical protein GS4_06_00060 [Gordonia soli NBRC 108243]
MPPDVVVVVSVEVSVDVSGVVGSLVAGSLVVSPVSPGSVVSGSLVAGPVGSTGSVTPPVGSPVPSWSPES